MAAMLINTPIHFLTLKHFIEKKQQTFKDIKVAILFATEKQEYSNNMIVMTPKEGPTYARNSPIELNGHFTCRRPQKLGLKC